MRVVGWKARDEAEGAIHSVGIDRNFSHDRITPAPPPSVTAVEMRCIGGARLGSSVEQWQLGGKASAAAEKAHAQ
jgi:hypothetical protein